MENRTLVHVVANDDCIRMHTYSRNGKYPRWFYFLRSSLEELEQRVEVIAQDANSFAVLRRDAQANTVTITFTWLSNSGDKNVGTGSRIRKQERGNTMEKNTVEKFKKENRPVWFLGTWSALPVKARITNLCKDDRAGEYAEVDCIHDAECDAYGSRGVHFNDLYPSKEDLLAAMYETEQGKIAEIKASIQTKDDCIRFMP